MEEVFKMYAMGDGEPGKEPAELDPDHEEDFEEDDDEISSVITSSDDDEDVVSSAVVVVVEEPAAQPARKKAAKNPAALERPDRIVARSGPCAG